jgi:hypothetical protein
MYRFGKNDLNSEDELPRGLVQDRKKQASNTHKITLLVSHNKQRCSSSSTSTDEKAAASTSQILQVQELQLAKTISW